MRPATQPADSRSARAPTGFKLCRDSPTRSSSGRGKCCCEVRPEGERSTMSPCSWRRRRCIGLRSWGWLLLSYPQDRWFFHKRLVPAQGQRDGISLLNQEVDLRHLFLKCHEERSLTGLDRQKKAIRLAQFPHDLSVDGFSFFPPKRFGKIGTGHVRPIDRSNRAERNPNQQDENDHLRLHDEPPFSRESLPATARRFPRAGDGRRGAQLRISIQIKMGESSVRGGYSTR